MIIYFVLLSLVLVFNVHMLYKNKEKFELEHIDNIMFKKDTNARNIYDYTKVDKT